MDQVQKIVRRLFWPLLIGALILSFFVSKPVYLTIFGVLAIFAAIDLARVLRGRQLRYPFRRVS